MNSNYFTVDKEKIEKRDAERDYTISYHDLLDADKENATIDFVPAAIWG